MKKQRVFKVVRPGAEGETLISAMLPVHLAETYRTAEGTIVPVREAMGFRHLLDAEQWAYPYIHLDLQVWLAEADEIRASHRRLGLHSTRHANRIWDITPDEVSPERWAEMRRWLTSSRLAIPQEIGTMFGIEYHRVMSTPDGGSVTADVHSRLLSTLICTNLVLKERVPQ